ncbi:MAG: spermidine/putrescine ABC transporter substrate-binding protein [Opitutaceae bacterium]|nr:spermidine/putrescine ABC transporter substrate-binding protein [Opitutaceae bacterium]
MTQANRQALSVAVVLVGLILVGFWYFRAPRPVLSLYVWEGYFPADVLADFEAESGARIKLSIYGSNDEMMARVKVSWSEFDVIMPSNYVLSEMRRLYLLERLPPEEIPNQRNIDRFYYKSDLGQGDNFEYGIPYLVNYAGIGYVERLVSEPPATWKEYFGPVFRRTYGDRLAVLDEPRETLGLALIGLGYSPNTEIEAELQELREFIVQPRSPRGPSRFVLSEGRKLLAEEEIALVSTWSPEITDAKEQNADVKYVLPQDGSILTIDTLAVPRSSKPAQKALAKQFIDFVLRPEIARRVTIHSSYANSLSDDVDDMPEALKSTPSYAQPLPEKTFMLQDVNDAQHFYDSIWAAYRD